MSRTTSISYLYQDGDGFHFMNQETYDQVQVPADIIGDQAAYLQEGMVVKLSHARGHRRSRSRLPQKVTLEIVDTEPAMKGQTASARSSRPCCRTACAPWCRHISRRHARRREDRRRLLRRARQGLDADARAHFFWEQIIRRKLFCRDALRVGKTAERFQRLAVFLQVRTETGRRRSSCPTRR